ncbi:MAG: cardiolipin synthase [bacterium]
MRIITSHLFTIIGFVLAIVLIARLMRERRSPGSTVAWLLAIVMIPHIGIPFYLLFGGRKIKRMIGKKVHLYSSEPSHTNHQGKRISNTERILVRSGAPPAMEGNQIELLSNGVLAYSRLMEVLEGAGHSIDITTFILGRDDVGRDIVGILTRKAREGVAVRLILDSLGCFRTRGRFVDPLRNAGGRVGIFMPILPFHRKWSTHLRNHRKIVIADRCTAIVGGMNLASTYLGPRSDTSRWYDFDVLVKGPLVSPICEIFQADWSFATGNGSAGIVQDSMPCNDCHMPDGVTAQVAASGPDVPTDSLSDAILSAILEARRRVWIITPYFIPDESLLKSLGLLAQWGRDIRIITPARSNHLLADLARGSYLRTLAEAGARIAFFQPGMLHSKIMLIDHSIAVVGSANVDLRSLYFNYEISLFIYSPPQVSAIERIIASSILPHTKEMEYGSPSFKRGMRRWVEDISRVLSPFL